MSLHPRPIIFLQNGLPSPVKSTVATAHNGIMIVWQNVVAKLLRNDDLSNWFGGFLSISGPGLVKMIKHIIGKTILITGKGNATGHGNIIWQNSRLVVLIKWPNLRTVLLQSNNVNINGVQVSLTAHYTCHHIHQHHHHCHIQMHIESMVVAFQPQWLKHQHVWGKVRVGHVIVLFVGRIINVRQSISIGVVLSCGLHYTHNFA